MQRPTHPTAKGRLHRLASPGFGWCARCGEPWNHVEGHSTPYGNNGSGCFPLCESCWASLTPDERLPYYEGLVNLWLQQWPMGREKYERDWLAIQEAVKAGL